MKFHINTILSIIILIFINLTNEITIRFVTNSYRVLDHAFPIIVNHFNEYSEENGLDIFVEFTLFSETQTMSKYNDYDSTFDLIKSRKYDLFAYDPLYIKEFSPYLEDLQDWLSEDTLKKYNTPDIYKLGVHNNHWFGLPIVLFHLVLFSNKFYLNKYHRDVPSTWDELIKTSDYILKEELLNNNTNLVGYNGFFPENQNAVNSLLQFIYSFRETKDSPQPEFDSKEALEALNKLMEIQESISTNQIFKSNEIYNMMAIAEGSYLFSSFYNTMENEKYTVSLSPGKKYGISGSTIGSYNLGINKRVPEERKKSVAKVIEFFLSEEVQKNIIIKGLHLYSPLKNLYNDEEVCSILNCTLAKEMQSFHRPRNEIQSFDRFYKKALPFIYKFLNKELSAKETLENIGDINKIYYLKINNGVGLFLFIELIVFSCLISCSVVLLFIPKYKSYFEFLSLDLWLIYSLGSVLITASNFFYFGKLNITKCGLNHIILIIGSTFIFIPLLYRLIINFPITNKSTRWIGKNKILFISFILIPQIIFSLIVFFLKGFKEKYIVIDDIKNFCICTANNKSTFFIEQFQIIYNGILYFMICILIFFEWNITATHKSMKALAFLLVIDAITQFFVILITNLNITNYIIYYTLIINFLLLLPFINQIYIFYVRVFLGFLYNKNDDQKKIIDKLLYLNNVTTSNIKYSEFSQSTENGNGDSHTNPRNSEPNLLKTNQTKLIDIHYARSQT